MRACVVSLLEGGLHQCVHVLSVCVKSVRASAVSLPEGGLHQCVHVLSVCLKADFVGACMCCHSA